MLKRVTSRISLAVTLALAAIPAMALGASATSHLTAVETEIDNGFDDMLSVFTGTLVPALFLIGVAVIAAFFGYKVLRRVAKPS